MGLITVRRKVGYGDVWVHDYGEIKEGETFLMPVEEALEREDWEMVGYVPDPKSDEPDPDRASPALSAGLANPPCRDAGAIRRRALS